MADTTRMQDGAKNDIYEVKNMTASKNESTEVQTSAFKYWKAKYIQRRSVQKGAKGKTWGKIEIEILRTICVFLEHA